MPTQIQYYHYQNQGPELFYIFWWWRMNGLEHRISSSVPPFCHLDLPLPLPPPLPINLIIKGREEGGCKEETPPPQKLAQLLVDWKKYHIFYRQPRGLWYIRCGYKILYCMYIIVDGIHMFKNLFFLGRFQASGGIVKYKSEGTPDKLRTRTSKSRGGQRRFESPRVSARPLFNSLFRDR